MLEALQTLDGNILLFLQDFVRCKPLSAFFIPYTTIGEHGELWILLGFLLVLRPKTRKAGVFSLLALLLCWMLNDLFLKDFVARPRPFHTVPGLEAMQIPFFPTSFSFPSGHSVSSFASVNGASLGLKNRKLKVFLFVLAFLMAFSRLYLGVHYPSDVICGAIEGIVGSWLLWVGLNKSYDRLTTKNQ